jgi:GR25 family glycosyltransferase involved in LPS biosynthesis
MVINTTIDAVYYINMNKSIKRREHMIELLKDDIFDNMKKHRSIAIDRSKKNIMSVLKANLVNINLEKCSIIEYACLLSHLKTIVKFAKSDYNIALILEDDVSLEYKQYWKNSLEDCILNAPKDWGILQLCYLRLNPNKIKKNLYNSEYSTSSVAYLINKNSALKFLKKIYVNNKFILNKDYNHQSDGLLYSLIKTYLYKYPYFTYKTDNSTIHPHHIKEYHIPSKKILTKFVKERK